MSFRLLPNKVYATNPTHVGTIIFQAVNGNAELFGTNVTHYTKNDNKQRIIIPNFNELLPIWDDLILKDHFVPMTCLTAWIGFKTKEEGTELWLNQGINIRLTPTDDYIE